MPKDLAIRRISRQLFVVKADSVLKITPPFVFVTAAAARKLIAMYAYVMPAGATKLAATTKVASLVVVMYLIFFSELGLRNKFLHLKKSMRTEAQNVRIS